MADQNPPCAGIFAEILCQLQERTRQTRFYGQKAVGGHGLCGAHNSAVIGSHDNATESPTATVANQQPDALQKQQRGV